MKNVMMSLYLLSIALLGCGQGPGFEKVAEDAVNNEKRKVAEQFVDRYFSASDGEQAYEFEEAEATQAMKELLTEDQQKMLFLQMKSQLGIYESSTYAETWKQRGMPGMDIFRFKADFSESKKKAEVRVVLDDENRLAGFWVKPWNDILN